MAENGNAVALRDALKYARDVLALNGFVEPVIRCDAALAAPARNCDTYQNLHEAWVAWQNDCADDMQDQKKFDEWLYAKADKKGGDE